MIEIGKTYKHPQIKTPYTALKNDGCNWIMVSAVAMLRKSLTDYVLDFTDYWKISEEYFKKSNMKEYDLRNLIVDDNFEIVST